MKTTRVALLASLLTALTYAAGQALAAIPNVELITFLAFISGYLLGPLVGAVVGGTGMGAHSLFNVMGTVAPPVWLAQVGCYAIVGAGGGAFGPWLVRAAGWWAPVAAGLVGASLVLLYQIVVNTVAYFTFTNEVGVGGYVWAGVAFAAIQVAWNAALFCTALRPVLRVLARYRRELVGSP